MPPVNHLNTDPQRGWRPKEWARAVGLSRVTVFDLLRQKRIDSVAMGPRCRIILTPPQEFLAGLREGSASEASPTTPFRWRDLKSAAEL